MTSDASPKRPMVVIVDDDARIRTSLSALVRSIGYEARAFASAEDFLETVAESKISCVICDVQLPGISGLDLQRRLASRGDGPPMMLMTAYPNARLRARALAAGAICFQEKPFDSEDLKKYLEHACGRAPE